MPTLLVENGFKFFFYANEHEPRHIHVMKGDGYCKVELDGLRVTHNHMKPQELRKALSIIEIHKQDFMERWDEYFR